MIAGNAQAWDIHSCLQYNLTPTVCSRDIIKEMALALEGAEDTCSTAVNDRFVSNPNGNTFRLTNHNGRPFIWARMRVLYINSTRRDILDQTVIIKKIVYIIKLS